MYADPAARVRAARDFASGNQAVVDADHFYVYHDAETLQAACEVARAVVSRGIDVRIIHRVDVRDITPEEDPVKAQLWEFEERQLVLE